MQTARIPTALFLFKVLIAAITEPQKSHRARAMPIHMVTMPYFCFLRRMLRTGYGWPKNDSLCV